MADDSPAPITRTCGRGLCHSSRWLPYPRPTAIPAQAKLLHQRLGTFGSARCRVIDFDVRERFWALDAVLDQLMAGTDLFRAEIARLA